MPALDSDLNDGIDSFIRDLQQGTIQGSYNVSYQTVLLLRKFIAQYKWAHAGDLINYMIVQGLKLIAIQPSESAIGNMLRRVLKIIREEYARADSNQDDISFSLQKLLMSEEESHDYRKILPSLKVSTIEAVNELITELETSAENIANQALEHIHTNEVIMTSASSLCSSTIEKFLKRAAKKRRFQVIVVENAPLYQGQRLALKLAEDKIQTTVINDSAGFAMMSRVNKVIMETHSVMANGGLKAHAGSNALALAARYHSVPLIVCSPMYQLSPQYLCSYAGFNRFAGPQDILDFAFDSANVEIANPAYDYVPPELVTLFITNNGGNAPSYIYRLLSELYHSSDYTL